jgi:hypothetical protein
MTATREDIEHWVQQAKDKGSAYLIIGLDPMDYGNFPVFCESGKDCMNQLTRLLGSGNSYDEVYDFSLPIDAQLRERRAIHLPSGCNE